MKVGDADNGASRTVAISAELCPSEVWTNQAEFLMLTV